MNHLNELQIIRRIDKDKRVTYWGGKSTIDFDDEIKTAYVLLASQTEDWLKWLNSWKEKTKDAMTYEAVDLHQAVKNAN